ncbi:MAG: ABC-F family ATP-binding cassette domain-containing protein [Ignavibacteriae bacterium]|nr:ABC-F family ATP-binding cassette domain-containing protein [Ignavibacteriota bacterium]
MIDINNLSIQFTGENLFENVNLKILPQDKIALVGSNGTGKSTFLKMLSGKQSQESGTILYKKSLKIGYLPQELISIYNSTIFNDVRNSLPQIIDIDKRESFLQEKLHQFPSHGKEHDDVINQIGKLNHQKEEIGYYEINSNIEKILMGLGFAKEQFEKSTSELSGGWQMRVELAKILASNNDIILLDEPTNHLDIDSLQWLVKFLKSYKGAIILVSHDRYFVNNICNKTLEIYNKNVTFYKGSYNEYLNFKEERAERLKLEFAEQQKKIKQTEQFIERFRYKATKAKQVQSRIKQLDKIERIELVETESKIHFRFFDTTPSGVVPIKINNISKSYGTLNVLENINLDIERSEKIALVGPNGAGKTTLSKILSKRIEPTSGNLEFGHNTLISFYAQDVVDNLNLENDIITELFESDSENTIGQLRTLLGAFLFNGDEVFKKIKVLSGGEKSRVGLAKVLLTKANTIILDEPTNHLDFDSKKILQNALIQFNGTLIIVSHDVDFLKPIVTKVIEVRDHNLKVFYGGIDYYLSKKEEIDTAEKNEIANLDETNKLTRKDQKRFEAERRQKFHNATKSLKTKINLVENEIEKLETLKTNLELDMMKEEVYSNPILAKQNKLDYEKVKVDLENCYIDWTQSNEELERIANEVSKSE